MDNTVWILEKTNGKRLPYRTTIKKEEESRICLPLQGRWPDHKGNIFCIRTDFFPEGTIGEIERVLSLKRSGKQPSLCLAGQETKGVTFSLLRQKKEIMEICTSQSFKVKVASRRVYPKG